MRLNDFLLFNELEQAKLIGERGQLIGERKFMGLKIQLYQISSFYVEIFYTCNNSIHGFSSFNDTNRLEPYLDQIDVLKILQ